MSASDEPPPSQRRPGEAPPGGDAGSVHSRPAERALAVLAALHLLAYADRSVVAALAESLRADLWLTDARIGWLMTGSLAAGALAAPAFVRLTGRRSRPALLALGVGLSGLATVLSGAARGFWTLLAARAAAGLGDAARRGIGPGLVADASAHAPLVRRAGPFLRGAIPAGAALGYAAGGLLDRTLGWRAAFVAAGAAGLAVAVRCLRLRDPERREGCPGAPAGGAAHATWRRLVSSRPYALAILGHAAHTFAIGATAFWLPAFLERTRGVPRVIASFELGAVVAMAAFAGTFAGGRLAAALRARLKEADLWISGIAALAAAPLAVAMLTAWRPALYLAALAAVQVLMFASASSVHAALRAKLPPAERAGAMATSLVAIELLGGVPAPALVGLVSDHSSLGRALLLVPAAALVAGAAWTYAAWRGER